MKNAAATVIEFVRQRFRFIWWSILFIALARVYYLRRPFIFSASSISFTDLVLFCAFLGVSILPLFSEIEFWGLKLKPDIDRLSTEVKDLERALVTFQMAFNSFASSQSTHQRVQQVVQLGSSPLSDDELNRLVLRVQNKRQTEGLPRKEDTMPTMKLKITSDISMPAAFRRAAFSELSRLCKSWVRTDYNSNDPEKMLADLKVHASAIMTPDFVQLTEQLLQISRQVIDGGSVSPAQLEALEMMGPQVLFALEVTSNK